MIERKRSKQRRKHPSRAQARTQFLRGQLALKLPDMLTVALEAYERIAMTPVPEDAKAQSAQQAAAKAALSHVEVLLKLAQSVPDMPPDGEGNGAQDDLRAVIENARNAIQKEGEIGGTL